MERKIAFILSGCGYLDGSEITESVSCLLALSEEKAEVQVFAPSTNYKEVNHLTQQTQDSTRNSLEESARIARSQVRDLKELDPSLFDGLVLPGGYGAVKNLSNYAEKGIKAEVLPVLKDIITEFHSHSKPIAAFCIAPVVLALSLKKIPIAVTIGNDEAVMKDLKIFGADPVVCEVEDYVTDRENKIITSPAYMYEATPSQVYKGIRSAIREFIEMS